MVAFGVLPGAGQNDVGAGRGHIARAQVLEVVGPGVQQLHHVIAAGVRQRRHVQRDRAVGQVDPGAEVEQVVGRGDDVAVLVRPLVRAGRQHVDGGTAVARGLGYVGLQPAGAQAFKQRIGGKHQRQRRRGGEGFLGRVDGCAGKEGRSGLVHGVVSVGFCFTR